MQRIYLDNNATTKPARAVVEAMLAELNQIANPSSRHCFGQRARHRLQQARMQVADFLQVAPTEITFTASGTEAINTLIIGHFDGNFCGHILSSSIEHSAVFATLQRLQRYGCAVTFLPPDDSGAINCRAVQQALLPTTRLLVFNAANNETGVKNDLQGLAQIAQRQQIPLLVDAIAGIGKESFTIPSGVSGIAISGHKIHGPKGVGCFWLHPRQRLAPLLSGGDQEKGRRAGTENLPAIVGFATAIALLQQDLPAATARMQRLRDRFEALLQHHLPQVIVNGSGDRIANTSNLAFGGLGGEELLIHLDLAGIAASHGSACAAGQPSRILGNMGLPAAQVGSSIRFSLSRETTAEEIETAAQIVIERVQRLRGLT